ncbi:MULTISPECIES: preprotein translocase subunit YajC [Gulbenkiania]|uniref:Sec translocon accessory complex subunit YajC n=2 Tax=Gulbenkiania TaxID=397456 RepID=A0A0K6H3W5_9NEIS|nr:MULTISPECIES: preprotein translocase subunit YajC [Gulbenkiania]TCW30318.1 preprotein translocase subunit YajC [Gulbenkiania mobilis]CUA85664.1 protein translocase subunit yajC [Gulbenkiania indica]
MFITPAYAATPSGFDLMQFLPMVVIFVLFWFLMVRPQQKRMKEHQKMLSEIQKGDEVVTQGGIIGRVVKTSEQYLTIEVANGVEMHFQRAAIASKVEKGTMKSL